MTIVEQEETPATTNGGEEEEEEKALELDSCEKGTVVDDENVVIGTVTRERMSRALFSREGV